VKIFDKLPNENIYKSDVRYKMKTNLNFESQNDDDNMNKFKLNMQLTVFKCSLLLSLIKMIIFSTLNYSELFYFCIMSIILAFSYYLAILLHRKNNYLSLDIIPLRLLLEIYIYMYTILKINSIPEFETEYICYFYIDQLIFNFLLNITLENSILSYFVHFIIILGSHGHSDKWFYSKLVK
jgi:hypothetical protein